MYCEECWNIRREANRTSCKHQRITKKAKIKYEKQKILEIVDKRKLWELNLMAEQYQVITLELPFMSQLVSVRGAFHKKMVDVRRDSDWTSIKKAKANDAAATRNSAARTKNHKGLCHYCTFGARKN